MNIELSVVKLKTIIAWSCAHIVKNNIDIFIYTWYIQPYLFYEFVIMPILFDIHWHHSKLRCICYALVFHEANYSINENVCVINIFMKQILLCRRKNSKLRCTFFHGRKKNQVFAQESFCCKYCIGDVKKNCIWICVKILNLIIWTNFISHQIMLTECSNINDLSS